MLAPPFGVSPLASSVKGKAFSLTLCSVKASLAVQVSLFFSPRPGGFYLLVASTLRLGHCAATKCPRMLVRNMCSLKGENGRLAHYRQFFFFLLKVWNTVLSSVSLRLQDPVWSLSLRAWNTSPAGYLPAWDVGEGSSKTAPATPGAPCHEHFWLPPWRCSFSRFEVGWGRIGGSDKLYGCF